MIDAARRRFVYQELFMLQLALRMHREQQQRDHAAPVIDVDARLDSRIRARFPFPFTPAQRRVCGEIVADMRCPRPMNRLLQGDVGSGKTAVAIYAMLAAAATPVKPGGEAPAAAVEGPQPAEKPLRYQAAIMAPTELLAEQHARNLLAWLEPLGVRVALLTGHSVAGALLGGVCGVESAKAIVGYQEVKDFGKTAWHMSKGGAFAKFDELVAKGVADEDEENEVAAPVIVPVMEFTCGDLAESNGITYAEAQKFLKENIDKTIKIHRTGRKDGQTKGKPSNFYVKI
jgi:hypothetical protein